MAGHAQAIGRGLAAGLVGTAGMTAFQRLVEMPITGRGDSYAPARLAETVLRVHPTGASRTRLNDATHYGVGSLWGVAYAAAARRGLRGTRGVATVFAVLYTGDVLLNTALGLYHPTQWSRQDWTVDVVDKLVLAAAAGAAYDLLLDPARRA